MLCYASSATSDDSASVRSVKYKLLIIYDDKVNKYKQVIIIHCTFQMYSEVRSVKSLLFSVVHCSGHGLVRVG